ncbi:hypothetical protein ED733_005215 [Metarhizium rileyi]|uniref:Uncharacterized protein n=1 Tax=Metarhizium rileyi (strain RCEF 4871) TaxID=1649241 RepID=A0A5C6G723_METRR|nr:hypothetical protein ED733_005215 [Metarhizium rileyi]
MRRDRQHRIAHVRATSEEISEANFIEAEVFSKREADGKVLRESYKKPFLARTSLMPSKDEGKPFPVGYDMGPDNTESWAQFQGHKRPKPISPNPEPVNLEAGMSSLNLTCEPSFEYVELVQLTVKFGKRMQTPLRCDTKEKKAVKTAWSDWEFCRDVSSFQCEWNHKTLQCQNLPTGVEAVEMAFNSSLQRLFYFCTESGATVYTLADYWYRGKNNSFYVYLDNGVFYLAYYWANEDTASAV